MSHSGQSQLEGENQKDRSFEHRVTNCDVPKASCFQDFQCFDCLSGAYL